MIILSECETASNWTYLSDNHIKNNLKNSLSQIVEPMFLDYYSQYSLFEKYFRKQFEIIFSNKHLS